MRTIKFRGKSAATSDWIYGNLVSMPDGISGYAIVGDHFKLPSCDAIGTEEYCEVLNDTIGQFIGITDVADQPIYEGDIMQCNDGWCYEVRYRDDYAQFVAKRPGITGIVFDFERSKVVGNVFDNPEILEAYK